MGICKEKPEKETGEDGNSKRLLVAFAVWLGITILVSGLLDLFVKGLPLGFTMPILNLPATLSLVLYYVAILTAAIYIGCRRLKGTGLRETLQRRVSDGGCRFRRTFP